MHFKSLIIMSVIYILIRMIPGQYGIGIRIDQWSGMEIPEINPNIYGQLIFDKDAKVVQYGKNSLRHGEETTGCPHAKK